MLFEAKSLKNYVLCSLDGAVGKTEEFFFDGRHWKIRYLIANTGRWLRGKQVLISPQAFTGVDPANECISLNLTRKQIKESPPLSSDLPVTRQYKDDVFTYYGWAAYDATANNEYKARVFFKYGEDASQSDRENERRSADPDLISMKDITGYEIITLSGEFGCVLDFIIDADDWTIRYLVVDTRDKWSGKKILLSPQWIEKISWGDSKVFINLACESIKLSPAYTGIAMLTPEYEATLYNNCSCPR
jgi:hypothetical protein